MNNSEFEKNNFTNLIQADPERQKEIARAGGKASGISRRKKAQRKQLYSELFDAAFNMDFASQEELDDFRKWRRNKKKRGNK